MQRVIERLLNLLAYLLTVGRPVTAAEIRVTVAGYDQESDEAFRRMFERDKDLLRGLGIPLQLRPTDRFEVEEGYVVPAEEYALDDPGLTEEERTALWLAAQAVRLGGQAQGPAAMFKLGGAPLTAAGEPLAADLGAEAEDLAAVFDAVTERRRLSFRYRDRDRTLEPYGLVHRRGHWYISGRERGSGEIKAFRLDRAAGVGATGEAGAFRRPAGYDAGAAIPDAPWEAGGEDLVARVRFDPEVAWWARRQLTGAESVTEDGDGGLEVTFRVANPGAFIGWLIGFEDRAEILEPPELRAGLIDLVRARA
jgi:predicted DNA-binding transcriptional regulator YafY